MIAAEWTARYRVLHDDYVFVIGATAGTGTRGQFLVENAHAALSQHIEHAPCGVAAPRQAPRRYRVDNGDMEEFASGLSQHVAARFIESVTGVTAPP